MYSAATIPSSSIISNVPDRSATVEGGDWKYCIPIRRWNFPPTAQDDCQGVLVYLHYETMTDGGRKSREFISPGAKISRHIKGQMTPRKYTFG